MNNSRIVPVFQILAEDIHALGIRTVFGLMSDDTAVFAVTLDGLGVDGRRGPDRAVGVERPALRAGRQVERVDVLVLAGQVDDIPGHGR